MTGPGDHLEAGLSAFLDGELAPAARREAEAHLAACAECRAELVDVAEARHAVRALPVRPVPSRWQAGHLGIRPDAARAPGLADATDNATDDEAATPPTPLGRHRPGRRAAWGVAAAAAAVVALLLPHEHSVDPELTRLVDSHVARASVDADPLSTLAPIAIPVGFGR